MANTVARMQRDGLNERKPGDTDRRAKSVCLTHKANGLKPAATNAAVQQNKMALVRLTEDEQARLIDLMHKVIADLHRPQLPSNVARLRAC